jgi:hypothetical protein
VRAITGSAVMASANTIALIIFIFVIMATSVAAFPLPAKRPHIIGVPPLHKFKEPHRSYEINVGDDRIFLQFHDRFERY